MYANQGPMPLASYDNFELQQDPSQSIVVWMVFDDFSREISSNRQRVQCRHDGVDDYPYVTRTK